MVDQKFIFAGRDFSKDFWFQIVAYFGHLTWFWEHLCFEGWCKDHFLYDEYCLPDKDISLLYNLFHLKYFHLMEIIKFKDFNFYDPLFFPIDNIAPPLSQDELKIIGIFRDPDFDDDFDD